MRGHYRFSSRGRLTPASAIGRGVRRPPKLLFPSRRLRACRRVRIGASFWAIALFATGVVEPDADASCVAKGVVSAELSERVAPVDLERRAQSGGSRESERRRVGVGASVRGEAASGRSAGGRSPYAT